MAKQKPTTVRKPKRAAKTKTRAATDTVYQIKISLRDAHPSIWRRIEVKDCTLDQLHEHIQSAMGWTNSHLHHFRIGQRFYGDPLLMEDSFAEMDYADSTTTLLSEIVPTDGERFRFRYEYDFGDSWEHEIVVEKSLKPGAGVQYPVCVKGARACPPEDVGGVWGYSDLVKTIRDPRHEQHEEMLEWVGEKFDPETFDAAAATKAMHQGLPDWKSMI